MNQADYQTKNSGSYTINSFANSKEKQKYSAFPLRKKGSTVTQPQRWEHHPAYGE
jgi:hypothetical protein